MSINNTHAAVAAKSATALRQLAEKVASYEEENYALRHELSMYKRAEAVRALAKEMEDKGLSPELSFDEKVASISQYDNLGQIAEVIKIAGSGNLSLFREADSESRADAERSRDAFNAFCVTGEL